MAERTEGSIDGNQRLIIRGNTLPGTLNRCCASTIEYVACETSVAQYRFGEGSGSRLISATAVIAGLVECGTHRRDTTPERIVG
jgi:hypothetical protein